MLILAAERFAEYQGPPGINFFRATAKGAKAAEA
jgi:hypothetical protein